MEWNPEDVTGEKVRLVRSLGINRVSLGTQSFCPADLTYLKRTHTVQQSRAAIETVLQEGFSNISIDFIIGLPTQEPATLGRSFDILTRCDIPHVSAYILEDVDQSLQAGMDKASDLYLFTTETLARLGYQHYEVSNFCKPVREIHGGTYINKDINKEIRKINLNPKGAPSQAPSFSFHGRHNLRYWRNLPYIGVGVSASGFENGDDYRNVEDLETYFGKIEAGELPIEEREKRDPKIRRIAMGMRLLEGLPESCFDDKKKEVNYLLSGGFLIRRENNIAVAPDKILLLNEVLTHLI